MPKKGGKENALFAPESDRSNLGNGVGGKGKMEKNEPKLVSMGGFRFSTFPGIIGALMGEGGRLPIKYFHG